MKKEMNRQQRRKLARHYHKRIRSLQDEIHRSGIMQELKPKKSMWQKFKDLFKRVD